jgi:twitching motility protein PilT
MDFNAFLDSLLVLGGSTLSDLHFKVGSPPLLRIQGTLEPTTLETLGPDDTKRIATTLAGGRSLDSINDLDTAYAIPGKSRFGATADDRGRRGRRPGGDVPIALPRPRHLIARPRRTTLLLTGPVSVEIDGRS